MGVLARPIVSDDRQWPTVPTEHPRTRLPGIGYSMLNLFEGKTPYSKGSEIQNLGSTSAVGAEQSGCIRHWTI
jgi:hypothetical protein